MDEDHGMGAFPFGTSMWMYQESNMRNRNGGKPDLSMGKSSAFFSKQATADIGIQCLGTSVPSLMKSLTACGNDSGRGPREAAARVL